MRWLLNTEKKIDYSKTNFLHYQLIIVAVEEPKD